VDKALDLLEANFRHPGLRSHRSRDTRLSTRLTWTTSTGMTFERKGDTLILRNVDNHDECLRNP